MLRIWLGLWVAVCLVLFALGLFGPAMKIIPSMGKYSVLVKIIDPTMTEPTTFSIMSGIMKLAQGGDWFLAALVFLFTAVMPVAKLTVYWGLVMGLVHRGALWIASALGKFSMVDVLVIAFLVVVIKGMPGDTTVHLRWGFWCFCASVILSLPMSFLAKQLVAENA